MSELTGLKQETQAAHEQELSMQAQNPELDDDDDDEKPSSKRERRKIEIRFIQEKSRRHITFSKRKAGIMKKAYELSVLTGTQVLLLVVSETGLVYTFTTPKLQPLVTKPEGKNLIQACLNAPEEPSAEDEEQAVAPQSATATEASQSSQSAQQHLPPNQQGAPQGGPSQQQGQNQLLPPLPQGGQQQQGQPGYGLPPQMGGNYLNPGDQNSYYMGFNGNQGYN